MNDANRENTQIRPNESVGADLRVRPNRTDRCPENNNVNVRPYNNNVNVRPYNNNVNVRPDIPNNRQQGGHVGPPQPDGSPQPGGSPQPDGSPQPGGSSLNNRISRYRFKSSKIR